MEMRCKINSITQCSLSLFVCLSVCLSLSLAHPPQSFLLGASLSGLMDKNKTKKQQRQV